MSNMQQQNADGSWSAIQPLGWQGSGPDFEVYGTGPWEWVAYDEDVCVGTGKARTRIGAALSMRRFKRRYWKENARG